MNHAFCTQTTERALGSTAGNVLNLILHFKPGLKLFNKYFDGSVTVDGFVNHSIIPLVPYVLISIIIVFSFNRLHHKHNFIHRTYNTSAIRFGYGLFVTLF